MDFCEDCNEKCKYYRMYWSLQNKIKDGEKTGYRRYRSEIESLNSKIFSLERQLQEKNTKKIDLTSQSYIDALDQNN